MTDDPGEAGPGRLRGALAGLRARLTPTSRRGVAIAIFLVAGFGATVAVGGVVAVQWTETADFCGRCHTMAPEMKGYAISPHRAVSCTECHVEPGVEGWIRAKLNGTRQLVEVLTGGFPRPIPPPGQGDTRPTSATCERCHQAASLVANGGPVKLVLRTEFAQDEANTRDSIALVVRPSGFGTAASTRGVHWHVAFDVEYASADRRAQTIDLVRVTEADGTVSTYISRGEIGTATDAATDVDRILATETTKRMDCVDCHNRTGHGVPSVDEAVDDAMEQGLIDPTLPYIKQQAVARLSLDYDSSEAAAQSLQGVRDYYRARYPLVATSKAAAISGAISELGRIYELVATPEMRVNAATYPDDVGHTSAPGCFRCHDGGHFKIVGGVVTDTVIPSACATCHTFPEVGPNTSAILIGERPASHLDRLWVFGHKNAVNTVDPATLTCGACHTRTYCENCHATNAVRVPHDEMVFNHATVIRQVGAQACVFCHQPTYCAQCHVGDVLPSPGLILPTPEPTSPP